VNKRVEKKKLIIIIGASTLILGGGVGAGYFLFSGGSSEEEEKVEQTTETSGKNWNPYSAEGHHSKTLSDFLVSANGGKRIVKMTVTIDFASDEAYYKFQGYSDYETAKEELEASAEGGHGSEEEAHITPMELKINDAINDLMLSAEAEQLTDREALKTHLKEGINKALGFEEEIVSEVYIENYVVQ